MSDRFAPKLMPIPRDEQRLAALETVAAELTQALLRADAQAAALLAAMEGLTTALSALIERVEALERGHEQS